MYFTSEADTPLGKAALASDGESLVGLWFKGQKHDGAVLAGKAVRQCDGLEIFDLTRRWLDTYFSGKEPDFTPPIRLIGTDFGKAVWEKLPQIPYGETVTYGSIAKALGKPRMSAQAVGGAVGRNPIAIIVPCHRVIGADGRLIGYSGGLERKRFLLELESPVPGVCLAAEGGETKK